MVDAKPPKAGAVVAVVHPDGPSAEIEPRGIDNRRLKDSASETGSSYEAGLKDTRLGAQLLFAWRTRCSWILERAEEITIAVDGWRARSFKVELKVPSQEDVPDKSGQRILPLVALLSHDMRDVIAEDENGQNAWTLGRIEQQQLVGSMLIVTAEIILYEETPRMTGHCLTASGRRTTDYCAQVSRKATR